MLILIDTDVAIDLLRDHPEALVWEQALDERDELAICGYTGIELIEGCANKLDTRRTLSFINRFSVFWPLPEDWERVFETWPQARLSHGVSIGDMLIGECAKGLGVSLHTFNDKHFRAIPNLTLAQPYSRA